jgi:hypothetical protein
MSHIPKYRHTLNQEQISVLELLYKFRFASSDLVAQYSGKNSGVFVYKRLQILHEQGFIGKRFDSSYRLQGRPAAYYLTPKGVRKLQTHREKPDINIPGLYKEKIVSEAFVQHCMNVLAVYLRLRQLYSDQLKFFTKSQLKQFDYFPQPLPDAYISLNYNGESQRFFLDLLENSTPFFVLNKRIKQYIDYYESGAWDETGSDFPVILFLCETSSLEKRLRKQLEANLGKSDADELLVATAVQSEFLKSGGDAIWKTVDDPDEKLSLHDIQ